MYTMQSLSIYESKTIRHIIGLCLLLMMILFGFRQVYVKQRKFMPGGRKSKITFQEKVEAAYAAVSPCLTLADNFKPGKCVQAKISCWIVLMDKENQMDTSSSDWLIG